MGQGQPEREVRVGKVRFTYRLRNGTLLGFYLGTWYVGLKIVKMAIWGYCDDREHIRMDWKGWVWGWYYSAGWKFNFGKYNRREA